MRVRYTNSNASTSGFTLIELVVVVLIVSLLLIITLPGYQAQLQKTRRNLGGSALLEVRMRQEQFFVDHKRYAESLTELNYPASPFAVDAKGAFVATGEGSRIYLINIATRSNAYTLFAIPQLDQARDHSCGTLSLDSLGVRGATQAAVVRDCW